MQAYTDFTHQTVRKHNLVLIVLLLFLFKEEMRNTNYLEKFCEM
jgi:hypothetical protein